MIHRGSNPDVYVTWRGEFRTSQGLHTSQNHDAVLGVCSVPATDMRQNQPQADGRATPPTHLTRGHQGNIGHAPGPCQRTSSPPCIRVFRDPAPFTPAFGEGSRDCGQHISGPRPTHRQPNTPNERARLHLANGPHQHLWHLNDGRSYRRFLEVLPPCST